MAIIAFLIKKIYTPPEPEAVNIVFPESYTPPEPDEVDINF